jgi:hypothetical protein
VRQTTRAENQQLHFKKHEREKKLIKSQDGKLQLLFFKTPSYQLIVPFVLLPIFKNARTQLPKFTKKAKNFF